MEETILTTVICTIIGIIIGVCIGCYLAKRRYGFKRSEYYNSVYKNRKYVQYAYNILANYLHYQDPDKNDDLEDALGFLGQYLDD